jgi:hypothetical protein
MALKIMKQIVQGGPGDKLTSTDSLNVKLGLLHGYAEDLGKKILKKSPVESMKEMDDEIADRNYLSDSRKHLAALQLRSAMLQAKKDNQPLDAYISKASPFVKGLHESFIRRASDEAIASGKYGDYKKVGESLKQKD